MTTADLPFPKTQREFYEMFRTDKDCIEYLFTMRWPNGFECPHCASHEFYDIEDRKYAVECANCGRQISMLAGTVTEKTHTSLSIWFQGAFIMTTLKLGISALQFQQQAGIGRYETAFQILHKLRATMVAPERSKLGGMIECDETYIGGHELGKPGRGAEKKSLVVGAVEVVQGENGPYSGRIRLELIPTADYVHLSDFLVKNVERGTTVKTDGLAAYNGITHDGYIHRPLVIGEDKDQAHVVFPHIHRVFGNLKAWLIGTHHGRDEKTHSSLLERVRL